MKLLNLINPGKKDRKDPMKSTQTHLRIGEIRDDLLALKNNGVRAVLKVSSINFNLKSEQEQNSIIFGYQNFLNSLEFPIQILIRSKKLDIDNYISQIRELGDKQKNQLLQEQTYEYAQYVGKLVEYADIMNKEFYVIVPYDPGNLEKGGNLIQSFFQRLSPKDSVADIKKRYGQFDKMKKAIQQRINTVSAGLENCGLKAEQLKTPELIKLFYNSYNPSSSRYAKLKDIEDSSIITDEEQVAESDNQAKIEEKEVKKMEKEAA
jgi:hypothetical protein